MRNFTRTILMLGTAVLLQACQTTNSNDDIVVTSNIEEPDFTSAADEMSNGSVKVYGLDEPLPPPPVFTDAGPGIGLVAPAGEMANDPNVMVFSLDDTPPPVYAGAPSIMPPAQETPYSSPFPAGNPPPVMLQPPGAMTAPPALMPYEPAVAVGGSQIYFPHGSSKLSPSGKQVIDDVLREASARGGGYIAVEGHASSRAEASDPVEKRIVNLKMSMDRAFHVSSDMIRKGVPPEAIKTTVYGDTRPLADEDTSRRVEILTAP